MLSTEITMFIAQKKKVSYLCFMVLHSKFPDFLMIQLGKTWEKLSLGVSHSLIPFLSPSLWCLYLSLFVSPSVILCICLSLFDCLSLSVSLFLWFCEKELD